MNRATTKPKPRRKDTISVPGKPESSERADDYTEPRAAGRVLFIVTKWIRFGTDDKTYAAAVLLSAVLLVLVLVMVVLGAWFGDQGWWEIAFTWIGNAFFLTAGVAVGRAAEN